MVTSQKEIDPKIKTLVAICSQKDILRKLESAKIKSYLRFSIAIIPPKLKKILPAFLCTCLLQVGSQKNYRRMFKRNVLPYLASSQKIWLNIFVGHLPFWLNHKIDPKN